MIFLCLIVLSCGKETTTIEPSIRSKSMKSEIQFQHKRVSELFLVVFERNYSPEEWKTIFDLTNILSANKKSLRIIQGIDSDEVSATRAQLIGKNAEILSTLSEKSVFMLSWSAQDENCKITQKEQIVFSCRPRNTNNPLNGGLPVVTQPLEWIIPDPVSSEVKTPYLKIQMAKQSSMENPSEYSLELRLKEESNTDTESWLKGDVLPALNSKFLKADGTLVSVFFKYGYAELTLSD